MLIVLGLFFFIVWLVFFKFQWLPWTKGWKYTVWSIATFIAFFVVGALQYYTPASSKALVQAHDQFIYPQVSGPIQAVYIEGSQTVKAGDSLYLIDPLPFQYAVDNWTAAEKLAGIALRDAQTLIKTGAIPRITLDQRRADGAGQLCQVVRRAEGLSACLAGHYDAQSPTQPDRRLFGRREPF